MIFFKTLKSTSNKSLTIGYIILTVFSVAIFIVFIQKPKSISSNLTSSTTPIRKNAVNIDSLTIHAQKALNARQFLKALKISSTGLQNDSTSTNLLNIQATAYASQGRYALAIEALTKITGIQPIIKPSFDISTLNVISTAATCEIHTTINILFLIFLLILQ